MKRKQQSNPMMDYFKLGTGVAGAGIGLGIASSVVEKSGGNAAGVGAVASFLPIGANVAGGGILINQVMGLSNQVKKYKGKRRY